RGQRWNREFALLIGAGGGNHGARGLVEVKGGTAQGLTIMRDCPGDGRAAAAPSRTAYGREATQGEQHCDEMTTSLHDAPSSFPERTPGTGRTPVPRLVEHAPSHVRAYLSGSSDRPNKCRSLASRWPL